MAQEEKMEKWYDTRITLGSHAIMSGSQEM